MKNYLLSIFSFLLFSAVSGQVIVPIDNQNTLELNSCNSAIIVAEPYSAATIQAINISFDENSIYSAIISPSYFSQEWDIDSDSELRFYDGFEESAILMGTYNSTSHPNGLFLNIETNTLRIEFETTGSNSGSGFELNLLCEEALQTLPTAKFKPQLNENWYFDDEIDMYVFQSCLNDSINLAVEPIFLYPDLENQNVDSILLKWSLGDRAFKRDTALTAIEHIYTSGSGYLVTVYSQDFKTLPFSSKPESYLKFLVRNSPTPTFTLNENQAFCLNEPTELAGGMNGNQVIGATSVVGTTSITEFFGTTLYLPDGNNQNYTTSIEVTGFPEGTTISSASDLAALCFNMEHSFLGDLEMMLTCPNGTGINIFNSYPEYGLFESGFGGGGTYLGDPRDTFEDQDDGIPGNGFDYCFSDDAEFGTLGEEYAIGNTVPVSTFQPGSAMSPGSYLPEGSFESLIGCPVNGEWILTVRDNIYADDGFIFDWSLGFSDELSNSGFQNELVSASWETNDWITAVNEGSIEITPSNNEPNELIFNVIDANGCSFSKNLSIQIADTLANFSEPLICDLTYDLEWPSTTGDLSFISGPTSDVNISNLGDIFEIDVTVAGDYTFEYNYFDCSGAAVANLTFLEEDNPACITGIHDIDSKSGFVIAPNPASNYAEVMFKIDQAQDVQILVSTLDGKVVSSMSTSVSTGEQNQRVNLEKLEAGAYLVTIIGETFKSAELLIKQ